MTEQIIIKVERPTDNPLDPRKVVFERIMDYDSSLLVPYQTLIDAFKFIYPGSVISISLSSY